MGDELQEPTRSAHVRIDLQVIWTAWAYHTWVWQMERRVYVLDQFFQGWYAVTAGWVSDVEPESQ